jgi:hypothetical protein
MDEDLEKLIALAKERGSNYIKKSFTEAEFREQMAELGVYLLAELDRVRAMQEGSKRIAELNEIHNMVDHFRKAVFALKRDKMK